MGIVNVDEICCPKNNETRIILSGLYKCIVINNEVLQVCKKGNGYNSTDSFLISEYLI